MNHLGIDYGSNLAGTTAVCYHQNGFLNIICSRKKQNADQFIYSFVMDSHYDKIFLDAPLSLPLAYFNQGDDFFYRQCDRELKAMSPMFLGGLTARAMALRQKLQEVQFYETYPKQLVRLLPSEIQRSYKVGLEEFLLGIGKLLGFRIKTEVESWHMIDSILAWWSGYRHAQGKHMYFGSPEEGIVCI